MKPTQRELELLPYYSVVTATIGRNETSAVRYALVKLGPAACVRWVAVGFMEVQFSSAELSAQARDIEIVR